MATESAAMRSLWSFGLTAIMLLSSPFPPIALRDHAGVMTGKLEGVIRDRAGQPIPSAQVRIDGTSFGAVADKSGLYFINKVPAGEYSLTSTFVGYKRQQVTGIRIVDGATTQQDFTLDTTHVEMSELTIDTVMIVSGVSGTVRNRTGEAIDGAKIESNRSIPIITGPDGRFDLEIPPGKGAKLKISAPGYRTLEIAVEKVEEGQVRTMTIRLQQ